MKRSLLVLVLALACPTEAAAKCHHYRIWHFNSPQRCAAGPLRPVPARAVSPSPSAPVDAEAAARAQAIEKLKLILGGLQ